MIKRSLVAVALLAIAAAPAAAMENKSSDAPDTERVVCKTIHQTGSRLAGERVCKTKAEWDREKQEARNRMDEVIEDRSGSMNRAN